MKFIAPDVAVLDPWAAVASDYSAAVPRRRDFSLPQPYQHSQQGEQNSIQAAEGAADAPAGPGAAAADGRATAAAGSSAAAQQPAGSGVGTQRKKRMRSSASSYQPNERELEAAARHAAIAPQLAAAARAVQAWLQASGAPTVQQALAAGNGSTGGQQQQQREKAARLAVEPRHAAAAADPAPTGTAGAVAAVAAASAGPEPDFRAMFELRHNLKPKLELLGPVPAGAAGRGGLGEGAGGRRRAQDVRQPPAANLFNRVICSECGPAQGCSCGSSPTSASTSASGCERLAAAGGHPVLLPPRSRFLMSDARQLAPLVEDAEGEMAYAAAAA